jgi:hypothetical protein
MDYNEFDHGIYRSIKESRDFDAIVRDELNGIESEKSSVDLGYVRRGLYYELLHTKSFALWVCQSIHMREAGLQFSG